MHLNLINCSYTLMHKFFKITAMNFLIINKFIILATIPFCDWDNAMQVFKMLNSWVQALNHSKAVQFGMPLQYKLRTKCMGL